MAKTKKRQPTKINCARCGRRLRNGRWIFSRFTHLRYCWPGEGCQK